MSYTDLAGPAVGRWKWIVCCMRTQVLVKRNDTAEGICASPVEGLPCSGGPAEGLPCSAGIAEGLACLIYLTICYGCAAQVWFNNALERGFRRQPTIQSARSRSPRHGLVSFHGQQEPQQLQGAVAPALGVDPAPSSSERPSSSSAQPPLRDLLAEYFLTNTLSAQKLHIWASSSAVSGAQGLEDLVAAGAHGSAPQNLARDLLRTCTRRSPWPAPYFAHIPVRGNATKQETMASIPFLLPHEMLEAIAQANIWTIEAFCCCQHPGATAEGYCN